MKVKIGNLSIYHKFTEVEIEIPEMEEENIQEFLQYHEGLWVDLLDNKTSNEVMEFGYGHYDGYDDKSESETRFDIVGKQYGGHL